MMKAMPALHSYCWSIVVYVNYNICVLVTCMFWGRETGKTLVASKLIEKSGDYVASPVRYVIDRLKLDLTK